VTERERDGLADGQELFVKTVKTPKRHPTKDRDTVYTDRLALGLSAPAWAIARADGMVGFTHEDMGEVTAWLYRAPGAVADRTVTLRTNGNPGQANNFTSYELLQKPATAGDAWLTPEDFVASGPTWFVGAADASFGKKGQVEYLQIQVTVRTLPNRADTDADGLNDSEEMNLGADGFPTTP
jgi:hypothetical protein